MTNFGIRGVVDIKYNTIQAGSDGFNAWPINIAWPINRTQAN